MLGGGGGVVERCAADGLVRIDLELSGIERLRVARGSEGRGLIHPLIDPQLLRPKGPPGRDENGKANGKDPLPMRRDEIRMCAHGQLLQLRPSSWESGRLSPPDPCETNRNLELLESRGAKVCVEALAVNRDRLELA